MQLQYISFRIDTYIFTVHKISKSTIKHNNNYDLVFVRCNITYINRHGTNIATAHLHYEPRANCVTCVSACETNYTILSPADYGLSDSQYECRRFSSILLNSNAIKRHLFFCHSTVNTIFSTNNIITAENILSIASTSSTNSIIRISSARPQTPVYALSIRVSAFPYRIFNSFLMINKSVVSFVIQKS